MYHVFKALERSKNLTALAFALIRQKISALAHAQFLQDLAPTLVLQMFFRRSISRSFKNLLRLVMCNKSMIFRHLTAVYSNFYWYFRNILSLTTWSLNSGKKDVFYLSQNEENGPILSAKMSANLRSRSVILGCARAQRSSISFWAPLALKLRHNERALTKALKVSIQASLSWTLS